MIILFSNCVFNMGLVIPCCENQCTEVHCASFLSGGFTKGKLISKAVYGLLISPKKQTDEFVLIVFYSSRQTNQIRP